MREMFFACTAMIVIAVGANFVLAEIGFSSADQTVGQGVRLDD